MMEFIGKFLAWNRNLETGKIRLIFETNDAAVLNELDKIKDVEKLKITATRYKQKRSLDANGLLWQCLGQMAVALRTDKWDVYLLMLKRYGKYTHIAADEEAVETVRSLWRESEIIGETIVDGQKKVEMLCYFGSSTYNTAEFSVLLDGVISEMKEIGLQPPMSEQMKAILERWDAECGHKA